MTDQPHGRYSVQELLLGEDAEARRCVQDALDAGEGKKWHLLGASRLAVLGHHQAKLR